MNSPTNDNSRNPRDPFGRWPRRAIPVLAVALALVAPRVEAQVWPYDTRQAQGITAGLRSGSLTGHTELGGKKAPQFGAFLRRSLSDDFTAEAGGSYARIAGDTYGTDMGMVDARLLWAPYHHRYFDPYGFAGLGAARFDLDKVSAERSAAAPGIGWAATAPVGVGVYIPLFANAGIDLSAGYTYSTSDDLNAVRGGGNDAFWTTGVGLVIGDLHPSRTRASRPHMPSMDVAPTAMAPEPTVADPAVAMEHERLRSVEATYLALRDSLSTPAVTSSAEVLATMQQMVYFRNGKSDLDASAQAILLEKLAVFKANPAIRIVITGYASQPGSAAYNMALGLRRAEAARAYLVSQGIDPIRIEISTHGEGELLVEGPGRAAGIANRRVQFRLLVADPYLAPAKL